MKRIVVCADGTWNIRGQTEQGVKTRRPTNVTRVVRAIVPRVGGIGQVVVYHKGIGTSGGFDKSTGGAFGNGIEKNIRDLYRSILYNYEAGDELFFFGFSRDAFTVRTLAGFMNALGLVHKDDDYWVPEIDGCYEAGKRPGSHEWTQVVAHFEQEARGCPPIKFIGVWDTVGALGPPGIVGHLLNPNKCNYHGVTLNDGILNAFQVLSIDERRKPFAPSVWDHPAGWIGRLEQAWFAGVHTDVGGGSTPDGLANEALHWLIGKAEELGLVLDSQFLAYYKPCLIQFSMTQ